MKLSLINDLEDQMPVAELAGRVTAVFPRKEGEGEYGPWSFQDATLSDGETEVRLKFKNMEDMKPIQGKDVAIRANKSKAHGLTGVLKVVEEYKGKTFHKVQLTNSCKIVVGLPNGKDEPDRQEPPPITEDFIPMTHGSKGEALPGVDEAKRHIMRAVNLYCLCTDAVDAVIKPHIEGMSADLYQAAIGTLFIEASRSGFVAAMPEKPLPGATKSKQSDSAPF